MDVHQILLVFYVQSVNNLFSDEVKIKEQCEVIILLRKFK